MASIEGRLCRDGGVSPGALMLGVLGSVSEGFDWFLAVISA